MALTLKLRSGDLTPGPELQFDAPRLVVGRAPGCELQLPDPSVSSRHASFRQRGSDYVVVDEGSENGTFSGLTRLVRQAPHTVCDGELLRFGRVWVEVRLEPSQATSEAGASRELARRLVEHALEQEDRPRGMSVTVKAEPGPDKVLQLYKQRHPYVVGSQKSADLRLVNTQVPGRCLELRRQGDQLWLILLSSEVPATLSGRELAKGERTLWPKGAVLDLGGPQLTFTDPTAQILDQLERGPTERLSPDEVIDPPEGGEDMAEGDPEEADDSVAEMGERPSSSGKRAAPSGDSRSARRWAKNADPERWTSADALVFLLALGVLGVSLWAIRWLAHFGSA